MDFSSLSSLRLETWGALRRRAPRFQQRPWLDSTMSHTQAGARRRLQLSGDESIRAPTRACMAEAGALV